MRNLFNLLCCLCIGASLHAQARPDSIATALDEVSFAHLKVTADSLTENYRFEAAIEVLSQMVSHPKATPVVRAEAYLQLGILYDKIGYSTPAMRVFREAAQQSEALVRADTGSVGKRYNLARAYNEMGKIHRKWGETDLALQYLNRCNQMVQALDRFTPALSYVKNTLAISYCELAVLEKDRGNLSVALAHSARGAQVMLELTQSFPDNIDYQAGLANLTEEQGEIHRLMGDNEQALAHFEKSHQMALAVWLADTLNVENKNSLAHACLKLGEIYDALDSLETSLRYFEQYNQLENELYERYPENLGFKQSLAISYQYLGHLYNALDEDEKAKGFFEQFQKLAQELYGHYPQNAFYAQLLATSYVRLGDAYSALGQQEKCLELHDAGVRLLETLHAAYPEDVSYKNSLATSFANLAYFCQHQLEDFEKAKAYYQRAERLWAEMVRDVPQFAQANFYLGHVRADLAKLDENQLEALRRKIQDEPDRMLQYQQYSMLCDTLRLRAKAAPKHNLVLAQVLSNKAWCGFFLQKFEAGEADIKEGRALWADNTVLIKNMAPALLLQGKEAEALEEYKRWKDRPYSDTARVLYRDRYLEDLSALEKAGVIPAQCKKSVANARKLLKAR